ncbi:ATP-binding protein [Kitasatospora sp. NPDC058965]|uniref:ATP-binding protein n=1 Tax=Kitasatospora sp. NPDC058965 TaxID=3346682 RepID=UPI00368622DF
MADLDRPALVGRAREVALVTTALAELGSDGGPAVLDVTGEAGIGKSRLLAEVAALAGRAGLTVLRGRATQGEQHLPFQLTADAFADAELHTALPADLLAAAAPALLGTGRMPVRADRFGLHRAVAEALSRLCRRGPGLVMLLDDVHWADAASQELIAHLVRHPVRGRLLLVLARRGRQTPTALAATLSRGADGAAVLRLALGPLPEPEALAGLAAGVPRHLARELYTAGEGNPLYLLALLHAHRAGSQLPGVLGPVAPVAFPDPAGVPSWLGALLLDELSALTERRLSLVQAVAVLGDQATTPLLARALGLSEGPELGAELSWLARNELIRPGPGGRWALRHPVLRTLVYEDMPADRRIEVHRLAAADLARHGASPVERAHHLARSLSGWDAETVAVLCTAADRLAGTAPATAAQLLAVVLRIWPQHGEPAGRRARLQLARARAEGVTGHPRESRALLHAVIGEPDTEPAVRAEATALCALLELQLGRSPRLDVLLRTELARTPAPPPRQAVQLGAALGLSGLLAGAPAAAREPLAAALATAEREGDRAGAALVLALSALAGAYGGRTAEARRLADAAAEAVDAMPDPALAGSGEALTWLAWSEAFLDRHPQAVRHAERGLELARGSGQRYLQPHLLTALAFVHAQCCRLGPAAEAAEEAEFLARSFGGGELLAFVLSVGQPVRLLTGAPDGPGPLATAQEAVAVAGNADGWWATTARTMLGRTALACGDPVRALEVIQAAGGGARLPRVQPSVRPWLLETLVQAGLALGRVEQAERWAQQAAHEADRLDLAGQRGAALRARAAVARHRGAHGEAVRLLDAAAQEYASCGALLGQARSLLAGAGAAHAAGDPAGAGARTDRGRRLAAEGGARLLLEPAGPVGLRTVDRLPAPLAELTTRELEIAGLVAQGLSNQAVAQHLYLSRRTVETHVSAIYRKAGIHSRPALAALLTRAAAS